MTAPPHPLPSQIKGPSDPPTTTTTSSSTHQPDTSSLTILLIHARWNKPIIDSLLSGTITQLGSLGLKPNNILIQSVPGSYELPWACNAILSNPNLHQKIDAIIAIGTLIKGDTMHFEYISQSVSQSLMTTSLTHNKPIIFGVLTCLTATQAMIRSGLDPSSSSNHNHGIDWAKAAVDCAINSKQWNEVGSETTNHGFLDSTSLG